MTFKLGSPANDRGTITGDGPSAVTGRLGALPSAYPVRVTAKDQDTGRVRSLLTRVAEEGDIGLPAGTSALGVVAGVSAAEAATSVLGGAPARQTGELCMAVTLRESARPLRFCNTYAVNGPVPDGLAGLAAADAGAGAAVLESYRFGTLHPTNVEVGLRVRRGLRQAFIEGATAPARVRRGRTIRVRLHLRRTGTGARSTRTIRLRVPRDAPAGERTLRLRGTPADEGADPEAEDGGDLVVLFEEEGGGDDPGPGSLPAQRRAFAGLARYAGVRATFGGGRPLRPAYRDPGLRITGEARVPITIRR
jgi:hypothetical protein